MEPDKLISYSHIEKLDNLLGDQYKYHPADDDVINIIASSLLKFQDSGESSKNRAARLIAHELVNRGYKLTKPESIKTIGCNNIKLEPPPIDAPQVYFDEDNNKLKILHQDGSITEPSGEYIQIKDIPQIIIDKLVAFAKAEIPDCKYTINVHMWMDNTYQIQCQSCLDDKLYVWKWYAGTYSHEIRTIKQTKGVS